MNIIKFNGGHRFLISDAPSNSIYHIASQPIVGSVPPTSSFFKPKVIIKIGDKISTGQILFYDKKQPFLKFVAPSSGTISNIIYGKKRVLKLIEIKANKKNDDFIKFNKISTSKITPEEIINKLIDSGIWPKLKKFPGFNFVPIDNFLKIEMSQLYVSLFTTEPHGLNINLLLSQKKYLDFFTVGLKIIAKIFKQIHIFNNKETVSKEINEILESKKNISLHKILDKYPADNVGLQSWKMKHINKDIDTTIVSAFPFLIIEIGHLFSKGHIIQERFISVSGNGTKKKAHFIVNAGSPIKSFINSIETEEINNIRFIEGNILTGRQISNDDYLSDHEQSIQVIKEDRERIPLVFFRLGFNKLTLLKTWFSGFFPSTIRTPSTNTHGEERSCIQCGYCLNICPIELMPNILMKASLINDIEEMEHMDIDECIECELCTFICPSKIEIGHIIKSGKDFIKKEG